MKRFTSVLLLATIVVCLFAGCGGDKRLAQAVVDYEKSGQEEIRKLNEENPKYRYFTNPVKSILCTYSLTERDIADEMIEKYDFESFVGDARIYDWGSVRMIGFSFEREDFTEGIHRKLKQIAEKEPKIEELLLTMERPFSRSYAPKIEEYAAGARKINSEQTEWMSNHKSSSGLVIASKEAFDAYLKKTHGYSWKTYEERMNEYDDGFFEKNALIVTAQITRGSGSHRLSIDGVYISGGKAYVVVRTDEASMGTADMQYATLAVKVRKSDVAKITEVVTLE